jgi:hypothetical protein
MTYLLQFCGVSEPLQMFYLEQSAGPECPSGPVFGGFRPFQLDDLLGWAQDSARQRGWDPEGIHATVLNVWMERADVIRQWQQRLREEPRDRVLVAGLGTRDDWRRRCERMLQA